MSRYSFAQKRVTVIMPFRNAEKYLDDSISSILNQTFKNFCFIIVNDASTDASDTCVQKYLGDSRINYIKNNISQGITKNLNLALSLADTEYIVRMDGDDISEPNRIKEQIEFLDANQDVSVLGTWAKIIDDQGKVILEKRKICDKAYIKKNILLYNPLFHPSVAFRKKDILAVGGYNENYTNGQDMDLWIRLIYRGYTITNLPNYLIRYRYHANSTAHKSRLNAVRDLKIRLNNIRKHNIVVTPTLLLKIYGYFLLSYFTTGRLRQKIEHKYSQRYIA